MAITISFIRDYNRIQTIKARIPKYKKDIDSVKKMRDNLIDKANRVTDKYISHESNIMNNFADARKNKVESSIEFKSIIENYPDLKANNAILKLLDQLQIAEANLLKNRTIYSSEVAKYNAKIHAFPFLIFRRLLKLDDIEIVEDEKDNDIVSDKELGI